MDNIFIFENKSNKTVLMPPFQPLLLLAVPRSYWDQFSGIYELWCFERSGARRSSFGRSRDFRSRAEITIFSCFLLNWY